MKPATTAREALIAEALGELARLLDRVEALQARSEASRQALDDAQQQLAEQLAGFEARIQALTEQARLQAVQHIVARTDEAARQAIDRQSRAMDDAARVAFGAELGATLQRLQSALARQPVGVPAWLSHAATAAVASAATWALVDLLRLL
ncbi:hypothetical protein ENE75_18190 [Rubrivivax albus]|uniref:Uncharacterized protein n=1 Tax=Rubrivivax albus TaxID=2499835 RepID=A0A437JRS6_9BURK|nr:hypothetical protein ENE75_18190 [Rubrivivax albus]